MTDGKDENQKGNGNGDATNNKVCKCTGETVSGVMQEAIHEEWQTLAQSLDRAFFIIFLLLQGTIIIAKVGVIPWD